MTLRLNRNVKNGDFKLNRLKKRTTAQEEEPDVLVLTEAAKYLRVSPSLLYRMARERSVPCTKLGRRYVFTRDALTKWLQDSMNSTVALKEKTA